MASALIRLALISFLFVSAYTAPINEKRADGPGTPYKCDASYGAADVKNSLQKMGANSRGIKPASAFHEELHCFALEESRQTDTRICYRLGYRHLGDVGDQMNHSYDYLSYDAHRL